VTPEYAIYITLVKYIKTHGKRILSIAKIFNQKEITINTRALYRYYTPVSNCPRLENALEKQ